MRRSEKWLGNLFVAVLLLLGLNSPLQADDSVDISRDPFVVLFQSKLDEANSEVVAQEAKYNLAAHCFQTSRRLLEQQAISLDEYKRDYVAMKVEEAQVQVFKQRVIARKAVLDVVILNRLAGREVQQCI